jgi:NAD(P)-dependent dehydrogenase (short-subunit alcohol dehydrogenase family)
MQTHRGIRYDHLIESRVLYHSHFLILGIGREIVKALHRDGASVWALSRTAVHLASLVAECPCVRPILVDLQNWDLTAAALQDLEPLHCLVNCAGAEVAGSFLNATEEDITMYDESK